jgi:hypothetical protein
MHDPTASGLDSNNQDLRKRGLLMPTYLYVFERFAILGQLLTLFSVNMWFNDIKNIKLFLSVRITSRPFAIDEDAV